MHRLVFHAREDVPVALLLETFVAENSLKNMGKQPKMAENMEQGKFA